MRPNADFFGFQFSDFVYLDDKNGERGTVSDSAVPVETTVFKEKEKWKWPYDVRNGVVEKITDKICPFQSMLHVLTYEFHGSLLKLKLLTGENQNLRRAAGGFVEE